MITYNGVSKVILRICEEVNALTAAFAVTPAQIRQAVSDGWDAAFEEGGETSDNGD